MALLQACMFLASCMFFACLGCHARNNFGERIHWLLVNRSSLVRVRITCLHVTEVLRLWLCRMFLTGAFLERASHGYSIMKTIAVFGSRFDVLLFGPSRLGIHGDMGHGCVPGVGKGDYVLLGEWYERVPRPQGRSRK